MIFPLFGIVDELVSHDCPTCKPEGNHNPLTVAELYETAAFKTQKGRVEESFKAVLV